ncbi:MaoC/PaaZ C-terminal domain-containing protein [Chloroflexota bacterium]
MPLQPYWDDITEGQELPVLVKQPSTQQIAKFAGASGEFAKIHYDKDFAINSGLPGVIAHGWLTFSFMTNAVTGWMGKQGMLKKIGVSYRGVHPAGEDIYCKAKVTKKYAANNEHLVELEIWTENSKGQRTVPGSAIVALPVKN